MDTINKNIENILQSIELESNIRILDFIPKDEINTDLTFDRITQILENNNAFEIDIIYYSEAIKYLQKYDNSLRDSLNLASEMCYDPSDLSSEILASLLASDKARKEWFEKESYITDYLNNL